MRDNDVTSHVTKLYFYMLLVSGRLRVPNYSNMSYETQGCVLLGDVSSHISKILSQCYRSIQSNSTLFTNHFVNLGQGSPKRNRMAYNFWTTF